MTACVAGRKRMLGSVRGGIMRLSDAGRAVQEAWQRLPSHYPDVRLDAFVIMPDHVHGIVMLGSGDDRDARTDRDVGGVGAGPGVGTSRDAEMVARPYRSRVPAAVRRAGPTRPHRPRHHPRVARYPVTIPASCITGNRPRIQIVFRASHKRSPRHAGRPCLATELLRTDYP